MLIDPETRATTPRLFSRNRFNLVSVYDRDHGGPLKQGRGARWAREVLAARGMADPAVRLLLLTQPRFLGYVFNPVSFWLAMRDSNLVAVISEVSTPFGHRHSYLCHLPDFAQITAASRMQSTKVLHVSPFQDVAGTYDFSFAISETAIAIRILHRNGVEGVVATLSGERRPLSNASLLRAALRRPFGAMRTIALIYWQALRLRLKGAKYRPAPTPPKTEVS